MRSDLQYALGIATGASFVLVLSFLCSAWFCPSIPRPTPYATHLVRVAQMAKAMTIDPHSPTETPYHPLHDPHTAV